MTGHGSPPGSPWDEPNLWAVILEACTPWLHPHKDHVTAPFFCSSSWDKHNVYNYPSQRLLFGSGFSACLLSDSPSSIDQSHSANWRVRRSLLTFSASCGKSLSTLNAPEVSLCTHLSSKLNPKHFLSWFPPQYKNAGHSSRIQIPMQQENQPSLSEYPQPLAPNLVTSRCSVTAPSINKFIC